MHAMHTHTTRPERGGTAPRVVGGNIEFGQQREIRTQKEEIEEGREEDRVKKG